MKKHIIFLHVPKTGGNFIKEYLNISDIIRIKKFLGVLRISPRVCPFEIRLYKKYLRRFFGCIYHTDEGPKKHKKYTDFAFKDNKKYEKYPKIIAIRQPYDWYLSYFSYMPISRISSERWLDFFYKGNFGEMGHKVHDEFYDLYGSEYSKVQKIKDLGAEAALYLFKNIRIPFLIKTFYNYKIDINKPMNVDFMTAMYCWFMCTYQPRDIDYFSKYMLYKISPKFKIVRTEHLEEDLKKVLISLDYKEDILQYCKLNGENTLIKSVRYERIKEEIDNSEIFRKELEGAEKTYKILKSHILE